MNCALIKEPIVSKGQRWKSDPYQPVRPLKPDEIVEVVATFYEKMPKQLKTRSRMIDLVEPRQVAMYFLNEITSIKMQVIARMFDRDRTTVIHSIATVKDHMKTEPDYAQNIHFIRHLLDKATWKL